MSEALQITHQTPEQPLRVLYRDDLLVVIDKPAGSLIHRSMLSCDETGFILQRLRDQLGQRVYPVHRLDRPTSGALVFALDPGSARVLATQFEMHQVDKRYLAVVRGWPETEGEIDHPLVNEDSGRTQLAVTGWRRLDCVELPVAIGRYPSSRYALIEARPQSGRRHQIRRHLKHISHPLIGDTTYGEGRHNRWFREHHGVHQLLLHAQSLSLEHPGSGQPMCFSVTPDALWKRLAAAFGWSLPDADGVNDGVHCIAGPGNKAS